jgi:hypothetical protein
VARCRSRCAPKLIHHSLAAARPLCMSCVACWCLQWTAVTAWWGADTRQGGARFARCLMWSVGQMMNGRVAGHRVARCGFCCAPQLIHCDHAAARPLFVSCGALWRLLWAAAAAHCGTRTRLATASLIEHGAGGIKLPCELCDTVGQWMAGWASPAARCRYQRVAQLINHGLAAARPRCVSCGVWRCLQWAAAAPPVELMLDNVSCVAAPVGRWESCCPHPQALVDGVASCFP